MSSSNTMFAQPRAVLMLNNNVFIILTYMTEKQRSRGVKGAHVTDDNKKAKAIAAISMGGIIAVAVLVSGLLSLIGISSYYQPAMAQQDIIASNTTTSTSTGGGGVESFSSACAPIQTEGGGGNTTTSMNATTTVGGGTTGGANQSTTTVSEIGLHIEEACMALQVGDTQGALMQLNIALDALVGGNASGGAQGNMTTNTTIAGSNAITTGSQGGVASVGGTSAADEDNERADDSNNEEADDSNSSTNANMRETDTEEEEEDSECGGITVGGTSAADDYGCPPDPDY